MSVDRSARSRPEAGSGAGYSAGTARLRADRPTTGPVARLFGRPGRIIGLDTARALAQFALLALGCLQLTGVTLGPTVEGLLVRGHVAVDGFGDAVVATATGLETLVPLALVVIAGAATGVSSGGPHPLSGVRLVQRRLQSTFRGVALIALALLLAPYEIPFSLLLATIGAMALLTPFVLAVGARSLFIAASVLLPVTGAVTVLVRIAVTDAGAHLVPVLDWLLLSPFPPVAWSGLFLAGLAVGRLPLRRWRPRLLLLGISTGAAALAFGGGILVRLAESPPELRAFLDLAPAATAPLGVVAWCAGVLALIAIALCAGDALRWLLFPLSAAGSLASTAGVLAVGLILALDAVAAGASVRAGASAQGAEGDGTFGALAGRSVGELLRSATGLQAPVGPVMATAALALGIAVLVAVFAVAWRLLVGDGPVERLCRLVSVRISAVSVTPDDSEPPASGALEQHVRETEDASRPGGGRGSGSHEPPELVPSAIRWTPGQALGKLPY